MHRKLRALILAPAITGLLVAGCGDDNGSSTSTSASTPATTATDASTPTQATTTTPSGGTSTAKREAPPTGPFTKNTALTEKQRTEAQQARGIIAKCVRNAGIQAATAPPQIKSLIIGRSKGIVLRLTWENNGADLYIGGTPANARRTLRSLPDGSDTVRHKRVVVLFDDKPSKKQLRTVRDCISRPGV